MSNGQVSPQPVTTPRIESVTEATTTTSSKTPPSLSLQGPVCPSVSIPATLEELSPDSIDAHTFDFETIPHPHMEQSLKQGSLDLDSLGDSPESDFMSAVNEFVIEENPVSPNISDTQSPEMMVESLYSSVINAIDSRRMQDTKGSKNGSAENISLKACVDKCKVVAQESQASLWNCREELCQLKILVQREQSEFASAIKSVSAEILKMIQHANVSLETILKEKHFEELQLLQKSYEKRLYLSKDDLKVNEEVIKQLKSDITGLTEDLQTKQMEVAAVRNENETFLHLQYERDQKMVHLESVIREQTYEMQKLKESRETTLEDVKKLHCENEEKLGLLKQELRILEQTHLKELEDHLKLSHAQELEDVKVEYKCCIEKIQIENDKELDKLQDSSAAVVKDKDTQLQELNLRISELSDVRCKLEVELALKEGEIDEMKLIMEENKAQQRDTFNSQVNEQTEALKEEIIHLNNMVKNQKVEHELGLEDLKILLTMEKEHCISQLLNSHEAQTKSLQRDNSNLTTAHQEALERESKLREEQSSLKVKLEDILKVLEQQTEQHEKALKDQKEMYEASIQKLEEDREQLLSAQKIEIEALSQKFTYEKEDSVQLKDFELHMQTVQKELSEKVQLLQQQLSQR